MDELEDFDKTVLRDFLEENWSALVAHCEPLGVDPNVIIVALGGEPE